MLSSRTLPDRPLGRPPFNEASSLAPGSSQEDFQKKQVLKMDHFKLKFLLKLVHSGLRSTRRPSEQILAGTWIYFMEPLIIRKYEGSTTSAPATHNRRTVDLFCGTVNY